MTSPYAAASAQMMKYRSWTSYRWRAALLTWPHRLYAAWQRQRMSVEMQRWNGDEYRRISAGLFLRLCVGSLRVEWGTPWPKYLDHVLGDPVSARRIDLRRWRKATSRVAA